MWFDILSIVNPCTVYGKTFEGEILSLQEKHLSLEKFHSVAISATI